MPAQKEQPVAERGWKYINTKRVKILCQYYQFLQTIKQYNEHEEPIGLEELCKLHNYRDVSKFIGESARRNTLLILI